MIKYCHCIPLGLKGKASHFLFGQFPFVFLTGSGNKRRLNYLQGKFAEFKSLLETGMLYTVETRVNVLFPTTIRKKMLFFVH